jgi:hypothetical protein
MKSLLPIAAAAELPTCELAGFPISPHQVSVLGSAGVKERSPTPALMLASMPTSPRQNAVPPPCVRVTETAAANFVRSDGHW